MPTTEKHLESMAKAIYAQTAMTTQSWDAQTEAVKNTYREDAYEAQAASLSSALERCAGMEKALERFRHGIPRIDHNPTRLFPRGPDAVALHDGWWQSYFDHANDIVKEEVAAALPQPQHAQPPLEDAPDGRV